MDRKQIRVEDLDLRSLEPDSPIPLYHQIEADLRELITKGDLDPGQLLPPELELSKAYGVGRHTIRMAMSRLVADDLIARHAGRGTFVQSQAGRRRFYLDRSFTRQMEELGLEPRSKVLEKSTGTIDQNAPRPLRDQFGEPYLRLLRLRFGDDEPIGIQTATILTRACPDLEEYDFEANSLYELLADEFQLIIGRIDHAITASVADDFRAGLLAVQPGAPLLVVNTSAYLARAEIIEYTTSLYRADRYEYRTSQTYK